MNKILLLIISCMCVLNTGCDFNFITDPFVVYEVPIYYVEPCCFDIIYYYKSAEN